MTNSLMEELEKRFPNSDSEQEILASIDVLVRLVGNAYTEAFFAGNAGRNWPITPAWNASETKKQLESLTTKA